jgi:hypothetical protein
MLPVRTKVDSISRPELSEIANARGSEYRPAAFFAGPLIHCYVDVYIKFAQPTESCFRDSVPLSPSDGPYNSSGQLNTIHPCGFHFVLGGRSPSPVDVALAGRSLSAA